MEATREKNPVVMNDLSDKEFLRTLKSAVEKEGSLRTACEALDWKYGRARERMMKLCWRVWSRLEPLSEELPRSELIDKVSGALGKVPTLKAACANLNLAYEPTRDKLISQGWQVKATIKPASALEIGE